MVRHKIQSRVTCTSRTASRVPPEQKGIPRDGPRQAMPGFELHMPIWAEPAHLSVS